MVSIILLVKEQTTAMYLYWLPTCYTCKFSVEMRTITTPLP